MTDAKSRLNAALDLADRKQAEEETRKSEAEKQYRDAVEAFDALQKNVLIPTLKELMTEIQARGHKVDVVTNPGEFKGRHEVPVTVVSMIVRPKKVSGSKLPDERMPSISFQFASPPLGSVAVTLSNLSSSPADKSRSLMFTPAELTAEKIGDLVVELVEEGVTKGIF
jgi:hypothetical protein